MNFNDLLCLSQPAYRPCHSTDTALLKITKHILLALDGDVMSVLTLLDVSSAFDTIDLHILFHTFQFLYGISYAVLLWLESYSKDPYCDCRVHDQRTVPLVPHRVQFWVVAFSFVMSAPLSSLKPVLSPVWFVDDTQLLYSCPPDQIHAVVLTMQTCPAHFSLCWHYLYSVHDLCSRPVNMFVDNHFCFADDGFTGD